MNITTNIYNGSDRIIKTNDTATMHHSSLYYLYDRINHLKLWEE